MPKKRNFLGGMQNYDPKTGEYESRLTKANGEPATKENMPGGEEGGKSFKSFKKTEKPKKTQMTYDELGDYLDKPQSETVETIDTDSKKKGDEGYDQWLKLNKEDRPYLSDYLYNDVFNKDKEKTHDYLVSISKNPNRKDEYGNLLASDRAFKAGQRGARAYLENMLKYYDMDSLRGSNVFLGYMQTAVNDAIMEEGFNEEFDMTYQDINEILGSVLGEEIDMGSYEHDATKGWTRKPYKGYQPEETETSPSVESGEEEPLDRYGNPIDKDNLDFYDDEDIYETDEHGFVLLPKKLKKGLERQTVKQDEESNIWIPKKK